MRPLSRIRDVFSCLCLHPFDKNISKWQKCARVITVLIVFTMNFCATISSVVFFLKNLSIDLEASLYALIQIFGMIGAVYTTIVTYLLRNQIYELFGKLSSIYDNSK